MYHPVTLSALRLTTLLDFIGCSEVGPAIPISGTPLTFGDIVITSQVVYYFRRYGREDRHFLKTLVRLQHLTARLNRNELLQVTSVWILDLLHFGLHIDTCPSLRLLSSMARSTEDLPVYNYLVYAHAGLARLFKLPWYVLVFCSSVLSHLPRSSRPQGSDGQWQHDITDYHIY